MGDVWVPPGLVHRARDVAQVLLAGLPQRWRHTIGVARRAEDLGATLASEQDAAVLVASSWLHDVGYAADVHDTGFHPLDGARHLAAAGWSERVAGLVAHHSEALAVAQVCGLEEELSQFPRERSAVADALTYADQTVGPDGRVMSVDDRMADMLKRHGPDSPNAMAHVVRAPLLRVAVARVDRRLARQRHHVGRQLRFSGRGGRGGAC